MPRSITKVTELVTLIQGVGIPVTQMMWYQGQAPDMPYAVLVPARTDNVFTDNSLRMKVTPYLVELYQSQRSIPTELLLEDVLNNAGITWNRYHTTMDDDGVILAVYQILLEEA